MTNIIVFGKSRSFESYEYIFGEQGNLSAENTHREPIVKPTRYDNSVLHYCVRNNSAWLECYMRAKGFESERDGLTFGIAVKTMSDLNLTDTVSNILMHLWDDVANVLLTEEYRFKKSSIIGTLKNIQWEDEDISTIQSTTLNQPFQQPQNKLLLLVVHNIEDIGQIEHIIKNYEDVYIADNADIFKQAINDYVLKQVNNQIYELVDGEVVPLTKQSQKSVSGGPKKGKDSNGKKRFLPTWGKPKEPEEESPDTPDDTTWTQRINWEKLLWWGVIAAIAVSVIVIVNLFNSKQQKPKILEKPATTEQSNDQSELDTIDDLDSAVSLTPYNKSIQNFLKLSPQITKNDDNIITTPELTFNVSLTNGKQTDLVYIKDQGTTVPALMVNQDKRPDQDTEIIVSAYYNGHLVGKQTYTIAKKEEHKYQTIPSSFGTMSEYLKQLRKDLVEEKKYDWVIKKCQDIIDGKFDPKKTTTQNIKEAKKLKKEAEELKPKESQF